LTRRNIIGFTAWLDVNIFQIPPAPGETRDQTLARWVRQATADTEKKKETRRYDGRFALALCRESTLCR
jgi:hypothetical protein